MCSEVALLQMRQNDSVRGKRLSQLFKRQLIQIYIMDNWFKSTKCILMPNKECTPFCRTCLRFIFAYINWTNDFFNVNIFYDKISPLTLSNKQTLSDASAADDFRKHCDKQWNCSKQAFSPFALTFPYLFSVIILSAINYNFNSNLENANLCFWNTSVIHLSQLPAMFSFQTFYFDIPQTKTGNSFNHETC